MHMCVHSLLVCRCLAVAVRVCIDIYDVLLWIYDILFSLFHWRVCVRVCIASSLQRSIFAVHSMRVCARCIGVPRTTKLVCRVWAHYSVTRDMTMSSATITAVIYVLCTSNFKKKEERKKKIMLSDTSDPYAALWSVFNMQCIRFYSYSTLISFDLSHIWLLFVCFFREYFVVNFSFIFGNRRRTPMSASHTHIFRLFVA